MSRTIRLPLALLFALMMVIATASAALAFQPPGHGSAEIFTCDPNPVGGHPGARGLAVPFDGPDNFVAWNAVFPEGSTPLTLCADNSPPNS